MSAPPSAAPPPRRPGPRGGGCLIAISLIVGTIAGVILHEASIGLLAGFAAGIAGAVVFWLIDRRR